MNVNLQLTNQTLIIQNKTKKKKKKKKNPVRIRSRKQNKL